VDEWVDGWVAGKAGLRIAYSNQKRYLDFVISEVFVYMNFLLMRHAVLEM
jgi:hypothetical protein